jgi:hypothetical protein
MFVPLHTAAPILAKFSIMAVVLLEVLGTSTTPLKFTYP